MNLPNRLLNALERHRVWRIENSRQPAESSHTVQTVRDLFQLFDGDLTYDAISRTPGIGKLGARALSEAVKGKSEQYLGEWSG